MSLFSTRPNCIERTDGMKEQKNRKNGRLHVFGPKEEVVIEPIQTAPGWDASGKSVKNKHSSRNPETYLKPLCSIQKNTDEKEKNSRTVEKTANSTELQPNSVDNHNFDKLSQTTGDDESSNEHSENENGKGSAPIELLGEFLKAIMDGNYSLAKKLCQMILIYEPENTEAKQFLPLLEEKLLMENAQNSTDTESEETDEGSSDNSEEDTTSSSDSSDDESEESSDDSDENM
uniref:Glutamate rich 2 n=1 Tax=Crocodylus porosus TaxID=8502 RepID=A0A7M4FAD1_CROPO